MQADCGARGTVQAVCGVSVGRSTDRSAVQPAACFHFTRNSAKAFCLSATSTYLSLNLTSMHLICSIYSLQVLPRWRRDAGNRFCTALVHTCAHSLAHSHSLPPYVPMSLPRLRPSLVSSLPPCLTHSLTHSLAHPLTHSLTHPLPHSLGWYELVPVLLLLPLSLHALLVL